MAGGGAHEGLPLRDPGPAAWPNVLEDVLNLGSCCAPAKLDFGVGPASHSVVAARGRRRAGVHGGEGDASRSTIGPLQPAGGAWEFDDAYPDTWPEGVDLDRLSYAPAPQLHSGPAPHEAVLSAATTPSVVCRMQAGQHGSADGVAEFLRLDLGLDAAVSSVIRDEKIDAKVVLLCSTAELASLGIEKSGDQKKLVRFAQAAVASDAAAAERRADVLEDAEFLGARSPHAEVLHWKPPACADELKPQDCATPQAADIDTAHGKTSSSSKALMFL